VIKKLAYLFGMVFLAFYILNPGAGVFELIPDNAPIFGNLDEAAAVALLLHWWRQWRALGAPPPEEN